MALRSQWKVNKEEVVAQNGVVTAMQPPSAEAGLEMLKKGGNAIDAAIAMGFCNIVLEPYMATIAGLGYMVIYLAESGKSIGIDFTGRAPKQAHPEMYKVLGPAPAGGTQIFRVEGNANGQGPLSVTVPGTCSGFCMIHKLYGKLPLDQVLEPAIHLASEGFEANWHLTLYIANQLDEFGKDPYMASMWLPNDRPPRSTPRPGEKIIQKDLGDLLKRIAKDGAAAMYKGDVADTIDNWMKKNGGILTREDLENYQPRVLEPLQVNFKGYSVKCVPTPSGALTNLETFGILDHFDLKTMGHNTAEFLHLFIQAARHAFADRYCYLGDWEYAPVPLQGLLSKEYTKRLAEQVREEKIAIGGELDEEPWVFYINRALHDPWEHDPSPKPEEAFSVAVPGQSGNTTHINVVDKDRNAVSCTHMGGFNSYVHPENTGVYMTGGMGWFIPKPGYANSITGWKRPMTNMCPVMVFCDGKPVLCQGAPGARRIMNRGIQVILNTLLFSMGPQDAITAPTVDASGRDTLVDSRLPESVIGKLRERGHRIKVTEEEPGMLGNFSRPSAILIDYEKGVLRAGVDVFRPAIALGY